jgi:PKD repeat protein
MIVRALRTGTSVDGTRILRGSSLILTLAALLCAQVALAPQANAVVTSTATGHVISYQPTVGEVASARSAAHFASTQLSASAGSYKACAITEALCLRYFGGPVMRTASLTPVFWNPTGLGLSYPAGYKTEIEQFFTDVAADSGKETDFYSMLPQYYDTIGGGTHHVSYTAAASTPINDTDALPSAAGDLCATPFVKTSRPCVQDEGLRAEITKLIEKDGLATGIGHEYVVFFPPGIDSCFDAGGSEEDTNCSGTGYCGYHGTLNEASEKEVEYANEPDNGDPQYRFESGGKIFESCATKKGLKEAAITLSSTSHEISESITDPEIEEPEISWYDLHELNESQFGEIGDICAYEYAQGEEGGGLLKGSLVVPAGTSNQTINGHTYLLQDEWDNSHSTCSISERTSATKALFVDTANEPVQTGQAIAFNGSSSFAPSNVVSYEWDWGDRSSNNSGSSPTTEHTYTSSEGVSVKTFTVTLTVTDENGNHGSISHSVQVANRKPTAEFAATSTLTTGAPASFDASDSKDPDGFIASYSWNFGDGTPAQDGEAPSHTFAAAGRYTVTLEVTDDAGATARVEHVVTVAAPPPKTEGPSTGDTTTGGAQTTGGAGGGGSTTTPSNAIRVTGVKQNKKKGTAALTVSVPRAGLLSAREASGAHTSFVSPLAGALVAPTPYAIALASTSKGKAKGPFVKSVSLVVSSAGAVTLQIVPTAAGKTQLTHKHKLVVELLLAFTPTRGTQGTVVQTVTLVLSVKHK